MNPNADSHFSIIARRLEILEQQMADVQDFNKKVRQSIDALWPRNEFGLTEDEARIAQRCIDLLLGRPETKFMPWDKPAIFPVHPDIDEDSSPLFDRIG